MRNVLSLSNWALQGTLTFPLLSNIILKGGGWVGDRFSVDKTVHRLTCARNKQVACAR